MAQCMTHKHLQQNHLELSYSEVQNKLVRLISEKSWCSLTNNITWDVLLEHSKFSTACLLEHF